MNKPITAVPECAHHVPYDTPCAEREATFNAVAGRQNSAPTYAMPPRAGVRGKTLLDADQLDWVRKAKRRGGYTTTEMVMHIRDRYGVEVGTKWLETRL